MKLTTLFLWVITTCLFSFSAIPSSIRLNSSHLSGKISEKGTGAPLPGATISIPEIQNGAIADANGLYKLENVPPRKYLVVVSLLGYVSISKVIDFTTSEILNFSMELSITESKEIMVTGVGRATELAKNPVPALLVSKQYLLERAASTNIIDAISNLPGVNAVTTGPNVSKPFIRGLGFNRVLTLVDGVRQEGQQWGDEHGVEVDQNSIERVEVIKGPASLIYGSDAIAGVVNLIPPSPVPAGTISGALEGNYGSNAGLLGASGKFQGNHNGLVWTGIFSYKMAKNYQNVHDGRVFGTAYREADARITVGVNKTWGYSFLNASLFNDLQEIPDGSRDSLTRKFTQQITEEDLFRPIVSDQKLNSYQITPIHQSVQHYRIYNNANILIGKGNLKMSVGYQFNHRREFSHPQSPDIAGLNLHLHTFTYDFKYNYSSKYDIEWTLGLNGMYQKNDIANSSDFIIPNYHLLDFGPFIFFKKDSNRWSFSGGIRYDTRNLKSFEGYTKTNSSSGFDELVIGKDTLFAQKIFTANHPFFSGISGSFGISYELSKDLNLKADISRGFRAPNISELSDNGIHPGTYSYQIGNASFKPEFSLQEDIGLFWRGQFITGSMELFHNSIANYIYNQKLQSTKGGDSVIVGTIPTFKFEQTSASITGGELQVDIHPIPMIHFSNSVSLTYGTNQGVVSDSLKNLPFIPPAHTHSELKIEFSNPKNHLKNIYLSIGLDHYEPQYRYFAAYGTETSTSGYNLLSGGLGGTILGKGKKPLVNIYIEGKNLTNITYQSHLSRLKYFDQPNLPPNITPGIFSEGRNLSIKAIFPIYLRN